MSTNTQPSSFDTKHHNRLSSSSTQEESQNNVAAANNIDTKEPLPRPLPSGAALQQVPFNATQVSSTEAADQNDDNYNGIRSNITESDNSSYRAHETVRNVRTIILNPEAESAANATAIILLFIQIMGSFQKAKMNDAISNLQSIVAKITERIREMGNDRDRSFGREIANCVAESAIQLTSLVMASVSFSKTKSLRSQVVEDQTKLENCLKYETLKSQRDAFKNDPTFKKELDEIEQLPKKQNLTDPQMIEDAIEDYKKNSPINMKHKEYDQINGDLSKAQEKLEDDGLINSGNDQALKFKKKALEARISSNQTQIAYWEQVSQLVSTVTGLVKAATGFAPAVLNNSATDAKINEQHAEMDKEVLTLACVWHWNFFPSLGRRWRSFLPRPNK